MVSNKISAQFAKSSVLLLPNFGFDFSVLPLDLIFIIRLFATENFIPSVQIFPKKSTGRLYFHIVEENKSLFSFSSILLSLRIINIITFI
jgi:hypothetical protein